MKFITGPRFPVAPCLSKCVKPEDAKKQIQRSRVVLPIVMSSVWNARRNNILILLNFFSQMQQFRSITDETVLIYMQYKFDVLIDHMIDEAKR
jgi:hypothetical protein